MQFCKVDTYIKMIHNPFREWNFRVNWINFKSHFLKLDTKKIVELIFQTFWPWENIARSYKFENCSCSCDLCSSTSSNPWSTCLVHSTSSTSWCTRLVPSTSSNLWSTRLVPSTSSTSWSTCLVHSTSSNSWSTCLVLSTSSTSWSTCLVLSLNVFYESQGHALENCFESRF